MRLSAGVLLATLLSGCLTQNPAYDESDAGSGGGSASSGSWAPTTSGAAATTSGAAPTTSGTGAGSEGATGQVSSTTGSSGQADTDATTGPLDQPITCPGDEETLGPLFPVRDAFFITSAEPGCPWTNSDLVVMNDGLPCQQQNYGQTVYATLGVAAGGRAEYVVDFGVYEAMQAHSEMVIASAKLEIVPWWASDRDGITFDIGVVTSSDRWVEGGKNAAAAGDGDSSWEYRWIEGPNVMHTWSSGQGPAAGSAMAAAIEVGPLVANSHDYRSSSEIAGALLADWLVGPDDEHGLVLSTTAPPVLVKTMNADPNYRPRLTLVLCPGPDA